MPSAVPAVLSAGSVIALEQGVISTWAFVASQLAISYGSAAYRKAQLDDPADHKPTVDFATSGLPLIYGTRKVVGVPVWYGGDNNILFAALVWGEGEVYDLDTIYVNDIIITDTEHFTFEIWGQEIMTVYGEDRMGTDTQDAIETEVTVLNQDPQDYGWTAAHRLYGIAYSMVAMIYSEEVWGSSGLPKFSRAVTGFKVTDWRTGGDLPAYTVSLHNPIVILYDYLTNRRHGLGIDADDIDITSFTEAANYCDDDVTIDSVSYTRYTCDVVLMPDDGPMTNIQKILDTCRGMLIYTNGKWKAKIDKPETPSFTFDTSNIVGGWRISRLGKTNAFNRVNVNFTDADGDYSRQFVTVDSPTLREYDNETLVVGELQADGVTEQARAKMLGVIALNDSRQDITVELTATRDALECEVGDVVYIDHETPGWDTMNSGAGKEFRVTGMTLQPSGLIGLRFKEYADEVYDWTTINVVDPAPNTDLPNPTVVTAPGQPTVTEEKFTTRGGAGVKTKIVISWPDPEDLAIASYDVFYKLSGDSTYTLLGSTIDTRFEVQDWKPGTYHFKVRARNVYGFISAFSTALLQTIIGLYDVPSNVTNLSASIDARSAWISLSWDPVTDMDVVIGGYYRIRFQAVTSGASWLAATDLVDRVAGASTVVTFPGAEGTYLIKAVDSVGQESTSAATVVVDNLPIYEEGTPINTDIWTDPWNGSNVYTDTQENGDGDIELTSPDLIGYAELFPTMYLDTNANGTGTAQWALVTRAAVTTVVTGDDSATNIDSRTGNVDDWADWDGTADGAGTADYRLEYKTSTNNGSTWSASWKIMAGASATVYATDIKIRLRLTRTDTTANIAVTSVTLDAVTTTAA